ncbi:hypothetical protein BpHYR1_005696 [Brachionus plicatilis]|uniref:Uncharacterized protein n=1 Tax=Brachionus plicatilis TaxID=10195 RepID=A0A3M7PX84_BRAPC|nr:hypothetical protein BpHYR1_005696 [Brachionus plicatilis]
MFLLVDLIPSLISLHALNKTESKNLCTDTLLQWNFYHISYQLIDLFTVLNLSCRKSENIMQCAIFVLIYFIDKIKNKNLLHHSAPELIFSLSAFQSLDWDGRRGWQTKPVRSCLKQNCQKSN